MRMWMINPKGLCNQHLLGEHLEIHKHLPSFHKKYSVTGRIYPKVCVELNKIKERHDELAEEMLRRGYNHSSPLSYEKLPDFSYLPDDERFAQVDKQQSTHDLMQRCSKCEQQINTYLV